MRRVVSVLLVSMLLLVTLVTPAAAQTPIDERRVRENIPLEETFVTIEAEIGCGTFDVSVEDIDGKVTYVFITEDRHGNLLERIIFHTLTRYTNLETGASFDRPFDSVGNVTIRPDGSFKVIGRNDTLVWDAEVPILGLATGVGIWLIDQGRVHLEYDAMGVIVSGSILEVGETIDVCAALS